MKKIIISLSLFFVIEISVLMMHAWADVKIGKPAPNFTLPDCFGGVRSLSNYKGRFVVLEWFNPDCPVVKKRYASGNMPSWQKRYVDKRIAWVVINSSAPGKPGYYSPKELNDLMIKYDAYDTGAVLDSEGVVARKYGVKTTPQMFIIDPKGILIYQGAIDNISSENANDFKNSRNYVGEILDKIMSGKLVLPSETKPFGCPINN